MTFSINLTGKSGKEYSFNFEGDDHREKWFEEGFEVTKILGTVATDIPVERLLASLNELNEPKN